MSRKITRGALPVLVSAFALTGCGGAEESTVDVTLREFEIVPAADTALAGSVTFNATNEGPDDHHELVVIRTDLAPDALPTTDDGVVDEEGEGIEVIGEIEEFPPGETQSATFDLESGNYVLICNVAEEHEGTLEVHYSAGMRTPFTVE